MRNLWVLAHSVVALLGGSAQGSASEYSSGGIGMIAATKGTVAIGGGQWVGFGVVCGIWEHSGSGQ